MKRSRLSAGAIAASGAGLIVVSAVDSYRVRELLAALLIFGMCFALLGTALFGMWLIEELVSRSIVRLETSLPRVRERCVRIFGAAAHHPAGRTPWN